MTDFREFRRLNISKADSGEGIDNLRDFLRDDLREAVDELGMDDLMRALFRRYKREPGTRWPEGWVRPYDDEIRKLILACPGIKSQEIAAALDVPDYVVRGIKADLTKERRVTLKTGAEEYESYEAWACEDF